MPTCPTLTNGIPLRRIKTPLSLLILLAGVAVLGADVLLRGHVFSGVDLVNYFLPTATFARPWLREGVLPLWNPMTFCGWPLVGDPQLRWLYPPNLLLTALPPAGGFTVLTLLHLVFGAVGMWVYLRSTARVGPWAALAGAATFGLSGFFACHLMSGIVVFPATAAWAPWILLLGWRIGRPGTGAGTLALFALAIGAQIMAGAAQIVFYTWVALAFLAIWRVYEILKYASVCSLAPRGRQSVGSLAPRGRRPQSQEMPGRDFDRRPQGARLQTQTTGRNGSAWRAGRFLVFFAIGGLLGVMLAGASLLPAAEFGALSFQRGGGRLAWESVTECSFTPHFFWLAIAPRFYGNPFIAATYWGGLEGFWDVCPYIGIGPLAALVVALACWRRLFGKEVGQVANLPNPTPDVGRAVSLSDDSEKSQQGVDCKQANSLFSFGQVTNLPHYHLALAAMGLFFALGEANPLFRLFYHYVPGFDTFRVPARWMLFWEFGLAVLFALVLERVLFAPERVRLPIGRVAVPLLVLVALLALGGLNAPALMRAAGLTEIHPAFNPASGRPIDRQLVAWTAGALGRAAGLTAMWLVLFTLRGRLPRESSLARLLPSLALVVALGDVLLFGTTMPDTRTPAAQAREFYARSPLVRFLAAESDGARELALDDVHSFLNDQNQPELWANRATVAGLHDARGYYPLCLRWYGQLVNVLCGRPPGYPMGGLLTIDLTRNPAVLSLLNVKSLLSYDLLRAPWLQGAQQTDFGLKIYHVLARRGPAFLAESRPTWGLTEQHELGFFATGGFDFGRYAFVPGPPPEDWRPPQAEEPGQVLGLTRPAPTRMRVEVERGAADLLVVSEAYHPGWRARIDGQAAPVLRANHALLGVRVPPGRHVVELAFQPMSFRLGLYGTMLGWLILAAVGVFVATAVRRWTVSCSHRRETVDQFL